MATSKSSLQLKVASIFLLLALAFSVGSYLALQWMVLPAFTALEQAEAEEDLGRVKQLIDNELATLAGVARHYSASTASWNFLRGNNPSFPQEFVNSDNWPELNVELMSFFHADGTLLWGELIDPATSEIVGLHNLPEQPMSRGREFIRLKKNIGQLAGIVEGERGLLLVAMQPVHKDDGTGEAAGYLILGRFVSASRLEDYGSRIDVDFNLVPTPKSATIPATIPEKTEGELAGAHSDAATKYFPSHSVKYSYQEDIVTSAEPMLDVFGHYTISLEAYTPRMITKLGSGTNKISVAFLSIMSSLFVLLSWLSIRWLVVDPVTRLKSHMSSIRSTGDLSHSLDLGRNDELGELADEFSVMKTALAEAQRKLESARDEALLSGRRKSEFLASMGHEIRTPMNGVIGMTELLLKTELTQSQFHLTNTVRTSANSLVSVIDDILDFSEIGTGNVLLDPKPFILKTLVRDVNAVVAQPAHSKRLEYVYLEDNKLPIGIVADDRRIRQILINLISNAIKFTAEGEVVLSIVCEKAWWDDGVEMGLFKFAVSDTGIGISPAVKDEIFSAFSQADKSSTRRFGGTGLGLSISKNLVELMGGEIGFESKEGEGAQFWFTLPVQLERSLVPPVQPGNIPDGALEGRNILIVDDNATTRELLLSYAGAWGASAQASSSAAQALEAMQLAMNEGISFDIIVVDYHMPEADGLAFARNVLKEPQLGRPPLIILSSMAEEFSRQDMQSLGVRCYLEKPILRDDLYREIYLAVTTEAEEEGELLEAHIPESRIDEQEKPLDLNVEVLVAEDNAVNQELIQLVLQNFGCSIVIVDDGAQALAKLQQQTFDLVIMDCQMPVMDGFDASLQIREQNILTRTGVPIPILALTANVMEGDKDRCLEVGMDSYIAKPFSSETLERAIRSLLPEEQAASSLDGQALARVREMQREGQPDILTKLIDLYLSTSPALIVDLESGMQSKNARMIEHSAHTLKSSSANLGALQFAELCAEVEVNAREGHLDNIDSQCRRVIEEFSQVCEVLGKERKNEP